ncbi:MAG: hypothetical protein KKC85_01340 [Gammaproteobacteria bacterium]|nr:hypothetical protein [Gammaproteobacteria bacterium]MBU1439753.1 hypothetical protein [Gammaproteobacteria bacterium]MBU2285061.1 hypothetical protein [Gammaproteobacteria bacterium]
MKFFAFVLLLLMTWVLALFSAIPYGDGGVFVMFAVVMTVAFVAYCGFLVLGAILGDLGGTPHERNSSRYDSARPDEDWADEEKLMSRLTRSARMTDDALDGPHGICPVCRAIISCRSVDCLACKSSFASGKFMGWRPVPLTSEQTSRCNKVLLAGTKPLKNTS